MTTHPANQTRAHLTEEFQIKVFDAGIELTSFEKIINHIAWKSDREYIRKLCLFKELN